MKKITEEENKKEKKKISCPKDGKGISDNLKKKKIYKMKTK